MRRRRPARRDAEFAARDGLAGAELAIRLGAIVREAIGAIQGPPEDRLCETRLVQGCPVTVVEAVCRVAARFSVRTGRIPFATRQFPSADLGFYRRLCAAAHNHKDALAQCFTNPER